jgi:ribosomal protein S18 acetylase RimI-like enzyme
MTPEAVKRVLEEGYDYHVAEDDGEIVGVVGTRGDSYLYHLYVDDRWQGRGLARQLWRLRRSDTRTVAVPTGSRSTHPNVAVGVYERFGFRRDGPMRIEGDVAFNPMVLVIEDQ